MIVLIRNNMAASLVITAFFFLTQISWSHQESTSLQGEKKRLLELLDNYDSRVRPSGANGTEKPVDVAVNIMVSAITSVSDYDMDFGVQVFINQEWVDDRLKYFSISNPYLTLTDTSKVWIPDLYIRNEKDGHLHKLTTPNIFIRIYPSGKVVLSTRLSLTLECYMRLDRFPFDSQYCPITMASYGHTTDDLRFHWDAEYPAERASTVNVVGFTVKREIVTADCTSIIHTGEYSCLMAEITFKRDLTYYVLHTFIPSSILVAVSWASFWIDRHAVVARILLVFSTLFALSSLSADIEASVAHVSYPKAIDVWTGACFTFMLAALVESVVVNATSSSEGKSLASKNTNEDSSTVVDLKPVVHKSADSSQTQDKSTSQTHRTPFYHQLMLRLPTDPCRIDAFARLLFPSLFVAFVVFYFVV